MALYEVIEASGTEAPEERRGVLGFLKDVAVKYIAVPLAALAIGVAADKATAGPIVDINENDNVPVYAGTKATWDITVYNNSDVEPTGTPYNDEVPAVQLYDLFSLSAPTFGTLPSTWSGVSSAGSGANLWDVVLSTNDSFEYIQPGDFKTFPIETYRDAAFTPIEVGDVYGQGRLETIGLAPALPGDVWQGPVGLQSDDVVPEPGTGALLILGAAGALLRRKRRY